MSLSTPLNQGVLNSSLNSSSSSGTYSGSSTISKENSDNFDPYGQIFKDSNMKVWATLRAMNECFNTVNLETEQSFVFGRHPRANYQVVENEVFKSDPKLKQLLSNISKKHFVIHRAFETEGTGYMVLIEDKSSNGTYVNGVLVGKGKSKVLTNTSIISVVNPQSVTFQFIDVNDMLKEHEELPLPFKKKYQLSTRRLGGGAFGVVCTLISFH